jgi:hypothetical protein
MPFIGTNRKDQEGIALGVEYLNPLGNKKGRQN